MKDIALISWEVTDESIGHRALSTEDNNLREQDSMTDEKKGIADRNAET